jgi:hypothetical protein
MTEQERALHKKISEANSRLERVCMVVRGPLFYRAGFGEPPQPESVFNEKPYTSDTQLDDRFKRYIEPVDFARYRYHFRQERWLLYGPNLAEPRTEFPFAETPKIILRKIRSGLYAHLDETGYYTGYGVFNIRVRQKEKERLPYHFLLGILNSKLINWWLENKHVEENRQHNENIIYEHIKQIPIHIPDMHRESQAGRAGRIAKQAIRVLDNYKKIAAGVTKEERREINKHINKDIADIDALTCRLYDLTDDEIKLITAKPRAAEPTVEQ